MAFPSPPRRSVASGPGPVVAGGTVFFGTVANHLHALDTETGEEKWKFQVGSAILSSLAIAGGTVYFGS